MVFPNVAESEWARLASDYIYRILIKETDGLDRFCFEWLQRREKRIELIFPNVDQPNEARFGVDVLRPICNEWLQRAASSVRWPRRKGFQPGENSHGWKWIGHANQGVVDGQTESMPTTGRLDGSPHNGVEGVFLGKKVPPDGTRCEDFRQECENHVKMRTKYKGMWVGTLRRREKQNYESHVYRTRQDLGAYN